MFFCLSIFAQENASKSVGTWYIFATNAKVAEKFSMQAQIQLRAYELAGEMQQFKIRVGGTYQIAKGFSGSLGYAYFRNDPSYLNDFPANFDEHRIYEVLTFKNIVSPMNLTHRFMVEHRFFNNDDDDDVNHWIRYMLEIGIPINSKWTIDVYDEVFLNLQKPNFAQNWLGGGISFSINNNWEVRTGYFHIHTENANFNRMVLAAIWNIDLTKTED
ncbi:DUF2490 domain-containing protein [Aureisphaera sp. CAU 1614]|uniref:DUF2490 domain-containing protein n=1 Tax=Halomarinibacterium sedimenti TaxID=2857106 RepID=A0A9X1FP86_9FLAO|nr:DUF2490 domain-containing protein [Halomarinibacterium sedimenti]MBW2938171.1 DUF2490 domain-containing protein [Halomarinibacterium sedimenti]